jgi:hypothetical protein
MRRRCAFVALLALTACASGGNPQPSRSPAPGTTAPTRSNTGRSTLVRLHPPYRDPCARDSSVGIVVAVRADTRTPLGSGIVVASIDSVGLGAPTEALPSPELTFSRYGLSPGRHLVTVTSTRYGATELTLDLAKCEVAVVSAVLR